MSRGTDGDTDGDNGPDTDGDDRALLVLARMLCDQARKRRPQHARAGR